MVLDSEVCFVENCRCNFLALMLKLHEMSIQLSDSMHNLLRRAQDHRKLLAVDSPRSGTVLLQRWRRAFHGPVYPETCDHYSLVLEENCNGLCARPLDEEMSKLILHLVSILKPRLSLAYSL